MKGNILIVEDDDHIGNLIEFTLNNAGYSTVKFDNANDALIFLNTNNPDLIVLDLMLPGLQGEDFIRFVKGKPEFKSLPILIVTAKSQEDLFVKLLNEGADDFLVKPFSIKVLVAKINAILRRLGKASSNGVVVNGIEMDFEGFEVYIDGVSVELTKTEFEILQMFLKNPNKVFTREEILFKVWGNDTDIGDRTVDVHVSNLRKKLMDKGKNIKSIPKVGYKFKS